MRNTLITLLQEAVIRYPSLAAVRERDESAPENMLAISFADLYCRVKELGTGLIELGFKPGQRAVFLAPRSSRSLIAELAVLGCRGTGLALAPDLDDEALQATLQRFQPDLGLAGSRTAAARLIWQRRACGRPRRIILLGHGSPSGRGALAWDEVLEKGRRHLERGDHRFDLSAAGLAPADTAAVTCLPEERQISHEAILRAIAEARGRVPIRAGSVCLSALPDGHPAGSLLRYLCLSAGCTARFTTSEPAVLLRELAQERPDLLAGTARLFGALQEELHPRLLGVMDLWSATLRRLMQPAPGLAVRMGVLLALIALLPLRLAAGWQARRIRRKALGGRLQTVIVGGAALSAPGRRFWQALGLRVIELGRWPGTAETAAAASPPRPATVSVPREAPAAVPREVPAGPPADGPLSGSSLEDRLRESPLIEEVRLVDGEGLEPRLLIRPCLESLKAHASAHGVRYRHENELLEDPAIQELIRREICARTGGSLPFVLLRAGS